MSERREYPRFVRGGTVWQPAWKLHLVGDVVYDITGDLYLVVLKEHWSLVVENQGDAVIPADGPSPKELGYTEDPELASCYGEVPRWVEAFGINAQAFGRAIAGLLEKRR